MEKRVKTTSVFFDGACPLCRREVGIYKKLVDKENSANEINWVDISQSQEELNQEGIIYEDAMRLIHIKDESGIHQVGLEGMLTLWDKIPYYRYISRGIRHLPITHPLLARVYEFLAKHRMKLPGRIGE